MDLQLSDEDLKEICQDEQRREQFLEQLIDAYSQSVLWLAYTYVKEKPLAEEITQDVFLTSYNKLTMFKNHSSIKTWIYRITINKCKDQLRKKTIKRFLMNDEQSLDDYHVTLTHPESIAIQTFEDQQLANRVMSLPNKYKDVIYMHYFEDMKIKEIGEVLHLKENTIKSRLNRGRDLLRTLYEEGLDEH
ncbi:sigma-70 family RNA polymerase sigma factor [Tuberibacillus sp. Marseille-P3662]|uniref:sigma-70 family RNA polymerase sigma factor n=1 Tax=Tuberibacillus sp. Marseille-P3662 TaxID=1965358 RepID=UPI000A1C9912|nr:sigma-70 family RNA polymerase sigma factor [Tuberibacillus sp. Marseille-P3662]